MVYSDAVIRQKFNELLENGHQVYVKNLGTCLVVWGYHLKELKVLLQRPVSMDHWMLPIGFVRKNEAVDTAAERLLGHITGQERLALKQFHVFSTDGQTKDPNLTRERLSKMTDTELPDDHWIFESKISVGFYALTEFSKVTISGSPFLAERRWWDINELPKIVLDHAHILSEARKALRQHIFYYPIGFELLEKKFTLPEIHNLYQTILGRQLDPRNFIKKFTGMGIVEKLDERRKIGAHRSPYLYMFNKDLYHRALEDGLSLL